jgi:hypothetical protein
LLDSFPFYCNHQIQLATWFQVLSSTTNTPLFVTCTKEVPIGNVFN